MLITNPARELAIIAITIYYYYSSYCLLLLIRWPQVLIMNPTRELAVQTQKVILAIGDKMQVARTLNPIT